MRILHDSLADAELAAAELRRGGQLGAEWQRVDTEPEYTARLNTGLDVILADYDVPGAGMLRALEIARERAPGVPYVIVSGAISAEVAVECVRLGADYVLASPYARPCAGPARKGGTALTPSAPPPGAPPRPLPRRH